MGKCNSLALYKDKIIKKLQIIGGLICAFGIQFRSILSGDLGISMLLGFLIILIASKLYKFIEGTKLKSHYQSLSILLLLKTVFRDKDIAVKQNANSLFWLLAFFAYNFLLFLSLIVIDQQLNQLVSIVACSFLAVIYSLVVVRKYIQLEVSS